MTTRRPWMPTSRPLLLLKAARRRVRVRAVKARAPVQAQAMVAALARRRATMAQCPAVKPMVPLVPVAPPLALLLLAPWYSWLLLVWHCSRVCCRELRSFTRRRGRLLKKHGKTINTPPGVMYFGHSRMDQGEWSG